MNSNPEKSDSNECSPDQLSSDEEKEVVIEDRKRGEIILKDLGDDEGGGWQLEIEERTFEPK